MNKVPTILWGFVDLNINFFNRLDIKFSICDNWSTTNSPGFFDFFNGAVPTKNDILTQDDHKGIFEVLEGNYRLLYKLFERHTHKRFCNNSDSLSSAFWNNAKWFVQNLKEEKIELVIFANIPHEFSDLILYFLCIKFEVRVYVFHQTAIPERFRVYQNIFSSDPFFLLPTLNRKERELTQVEKYETLFYMLDESKFELKKRNSQFDVKNRIKRLKMYVLSEYLGDKVNQVKSKLFKEIYNDRIDALRNLKKFLFIKRSQEIYKLNSTIMVEILDRKKRYVYIPLHLEPELTSSTMAYPNDDVLSIIHALRIWIPQEIVMVLKENPKQTYYGRGKGFYRTLEKINNLIYVGSEFSSKTLIKNCELVVTQTGTVGLEAFISEVPCICMGNPWYIGLSNVFRFDERVSFEEVIARKMKFDKREIDKLAEKCMVGVIDLQYSILVKKFNRESNSKLVCQEVEKLIFNI